MGDQLEVGQIVADRYVVEALIGVGGLAEVYRVRHAELGSVHALKLLTWRRKQLAVRFEREGRFQAQLGHPNVVTVTDFVRFEGQVALVMELVDGPTLEELVAEQGALAPHEAFALFVPILAAVAAAHDRGVLHRDLKPANVLLARTAVGLVPKVADFGIAKFVHDEMGSGTSTGMAMGSPGYMAPEQVRDSSTVDARADVFALAAILYEMLTGGKAFSEPDGQVSFTSTLDRDPPVLEVPGVAPDVAAAIRQGMARDRAERYPDCRSFARALGVANHPLLLEVGPASPISVSPPSGGTYNAPSSVAAAAPAPVGRTATRLLVLPLTVAAVALVGVSMLLVVAVAAYLVGMGGRWATSDPAPEPLAPIEAPRAPQDPATAAAIAADPVPGAIVSGAGAPRAASGDPAAASVPADPTAVPSAPEANPVPGDPAAGAAAAGPGADPVPAAVPGAPGAADPVADPVVDPVGGPVRPPLPSDPTDAVAVAPAPPDRAPAPLDGLTLLRGRWTGEAGGRRCELRFVSCDGTAVRAELVFVAGTETTSRPLSGTFDRSSGALTLKGDGKIEFRGTLSGDTIRGTYSQGGARTLEWSVSR